MNIYNFITPSDHITFKTNNNKVAFTCALLLGNGKAGCDNITTGEKLPTFLAFSEEPQKQIDEFIEGDFGEFIKSHKSEISDCFKSFAYGSVSERETYDDACNSITDDEKLKEFKKKHEDKNRSSMSQWVKAAWKYGENILK